MEKDHIYDDLMIRVLDGYATETEKNQLEQWLKADPRNQQQFADFKKIWTVTPDVKLLEQLDVEADLQAVKTKAQLPKVAKTTRLTSWKFIRRIAAVLLPLAVATAAFFLFSNEKDPNAPLVLQDGTKVWLYRTAKLEYPDNFTGNTRSVQLTGEAFFEVAEDATKPFIIEAGETTVQVLGTSFNVQSGNKQTEVIVASGKVKLTAKASPEKTVELTKGEKGVFANNQISESINKDKNYRSWQTGIFKFDGTVAITEVVQQLSKYYGEIDLNTAANPDCMPNATFEQEDLATVLEVIKGSCQLE